MATRVTGKSADGLSGDALFSVEVYEWPLYRRLQREYGLDEADENESGTNGSRWS